MCGESTVMHTTADFWRRTIKRMCKDAKVMPITRIDSDIPLPPISSRRGYPLKMLLQSSQSWQSTMRSSSSPDKNSSMRL